MVVLPAKTADPEAVEYAMDWVHYLLDPPTTEWGKMRAANGHPEPYRVPYFQIDNEPMNHGLHARQLCRHRQRLRQPTAEDRPQLPNRCLRPETLE